MKQLSEYSLDSKDNAPKYERVKRVLLDFIAHLPDDVNYLPFEYTLEEQLQISKRSIRRALEELRKEGIIETVRNRGSRIIKRPQEAVSETDTGNRLNQLQIASIFVSNTDDSAPTSYLPWTITNELENLLCPHGVNLSTFNLRDSRLKHRDCRELIQVLKEQNIRWAFLWPHSDLNPELWLTELLKNQIKPAIVFRDFQDMQAKRLLLMPGVDYLVFNHELALHNTLSEYYTGCDYIAYLTTDFNYFWSMPRYEIVQAFGQKHAIECGLFSCPQIRMPDCSELETLYNGEKSGYQVKQIMPLLQKKANPLVIGANDPIAIGVIDCLSEIAPELLTKTKIFGYDNINLKRNYNLTTFDFNVAECALEMRNLITDHLASPDTSFRHCCGKVILPRFIRRRTA